MDYNDLLKIGVDNTAGHHRGLLDPDILIEDIIYSMVTAGDRSKSTMCEVHRLSFIRVNSVSRQHALHAVVAVTVIHHPLPNIT